MSEDRGISREVEVEWGSRETMDISDSGFYHKVTISSWGKCYPSGLWLVVQDNIFCGNYRRDISKRVSKVV